MFTIGISFGFFMLGSVYGGLFYGLASEETAILVTLTSEIICFLLCVPLFFGYIAFCMKLTRGKDTELSELFEYYSSASLCASVYARFLQLFPALLLKLIIPLLAVYYAYGKLDMVAPYFFSELLELSAATRLLQGMFFVPAIIITLLCFYLIGSDIVKLLCFCRGSDGIGIIYSKSEFFLLRLSLLPLYALSALSFGVLFLAYTIPITVIVYSLFLGLCGESTEKTSVFNASSKVAAAPCEEAEATADYGNTENDNNGDTAVFDINDFKENN